VPAPSELSEHAAALYRGELSEFTAERNRLATELKKGGDKSLAAAVKALAKPSVSAWAVDQLYWRERPRFDAFVAAAAALRDTLREGAGPSERHVASREHREAHGELLSRAQSILTESGHGVAPALLRRIGTTLEAIATRGWPELGAGCLAEDLDPPGFEDTFALGGFAAAPAKRAPADEDDEEETEDEAEPELAPEPEPPKRESQEERRAAKAREAEAKLREAAKKKAEAKKAAIAAAREEAKRTARDLDARRRDCDDAEAKESDTNDALTELRAELVALQRKLERATSAHAVAKTAADACRERRESAAEEHERATGKLRALQDD
jgi:hypothetical protein